MPVYDLKEGSNNWCAPLCFCLLIIALAIGFNLTNYSETKELSKALGYHPGHRDRMTEVLMKRAAER